MASASLAARLRAPSGSPDTPDLPAPSTVRSTVFVRMPAGEGQAQRPVPLDGGDDLPELDSLLVIYPDEVEAFERQLAGHAAAFHLDSSGLSAEPDPLAGMTVREWPPLEPEVSTAEPFNEPETRRTDDFPEPPPVAGTAGLLLQASTPDSQERTPTSSLTVESSSLRPRLPVSDGMDRESDFGDPDLSFVRAARRQAFWRLPGVQAAMAVLCAVLLALLAVQWAFQERNRLAARSPQLRSLLVSACGVLGCALLPPRQIESVVIDSSSFNKGRGDAYQLNLTLKNLSDLALETPAVEVTLTDAQDQPVIRRVLLPTDLGAPSALPAHGESSASLPVAVSSPAEGSRVAGYRLLTFYP